MRTIVQSAFTPRNIKKMESWVRDHTKCRMDEVKTRESSSRVERSSTFSGPRVYSRGRRFKSCPRYQKSTSDQQKRWSEVLVVLEQKPHKWANFASAVGAFGTTCTVANPRRFADRDAGANDNLGVIAERLHHALGVELHLRESDYHGGEYLRGAGPSVHEVVVQLNFEDDEGYLAEPEFPQFSTLAYVTQSIDEPRIDSLASDGIHILRVEEL